MSARFIARIWKELVTAARRVAGVPDYDAYVSHVRSHHPERVIPSVAEFFADRQQARYRNGGGRCC